MTNILFTPVQLGSLSLRNRILMSPLTRSRSKQPGDIPWSMNADYYRQRASAGLIISEATQISPQGKGYAFTPGIYSDDQINGWKLITDAVHQEGGKIIAQLWHVGRISHPDLQPNGELPVAPSAIAPGTKAFVSPQKPNEDIPTPRALDAAEIPMIVEQYRKAAENAKKAGFDGVELHAANGYLMDQFLRDGTNKRTDQYGGSIENRMRFPLEVVSALVDVWGSGRVGIRISPFAGYNGMSDSNPEATFGAFAKALAPFKLAFLEVVELADRDERKMSDAFRKMLRDSFSGPYIANGIFDGQSAMDIVTSGKADAVTFGRLFLANPDLPERLRLNVPLNRPDPTTFYGGGTKGYTDYPSLQNTASLKNSA